MLMDCYDYIAHALQVKHDDAKQCGRRKQDDVRTLAVLPYCAMIGSIHKYTTQKHAIMCSVETSGWTAPVYIERDRSKGGPHAVNREIMLGNTSIGKMISHRQDLRSTVAAARAATTAAVMRNRTSPQIHMVLLLRVSLA